MFWHRSSAFPLFFFFSSRRRHTRLQGDWSSDVCSSDLFRNLGKNKLYSGINIIGLTVGLAACLLIGVFISHELKIGRASCRERVQIWGGGECLRRNGGMRALAATGTPALRPEHSPDHWP